MTTEFVPHFCGLWVIAGEMKDENRLRSALHFFGDTMMVFLDFEKPNKVMQSMQHYVLGDGEMSIQELDHERQDEMPIFDIKWRFVDERYLEFYDGDETSRWEPTTAEQLVAEGYPVQVFDSLRSAFLDMGSNYTTACAVPDSSVFAFVEEREREKQGK